MCLRWLSHNQGNPWLPRNEVRLRKDPHGPPHVHGHGQVHHEKHDAVVSADAVEVNDALDDEVVDVVVEEDCCPMVGGPHPTNDQNNANPTHLQICKI